MWRNGSRSVSFSLLIVDPEGAAKQWPLHPGPITVGRGQKNDLIIVGRGVSRHHAVLTLEGDQLHVEDKDSTYGTKINGRQMRKATINVGDHVDVGVFRLIMVPAPDRITAASGSAVPNRPQGYLPESRGGRFDEPTVGILTTGEFEITNPRIQAGSPVSRARHTPEEQPSVRRLGDVWEHKSEPHLGVKFVTGGVDFHEPMGGSAESAPVTVRAENLARHLQAQSGTESLGNSAALSTLLTVHRAAERLAQAPDLNVFLDEALDLVVQQLAVTTAVLVRRDSVGKLRAVSVRHQDPLKHDEIPVSRSVIDQALSTGRPVQSTDLQSDPEFGHRESVMAYKVGALLAVPLLVHTSPVGVLCLSRRAGRPFDRFETETVLGVGSLLARALSLRELERGGEEEKRRRRLLERFHAPELLEWLYQGEGRPRLEPEQATVLYLELSLVERLRERDGNARAADFTEALRATIHEAVFGNGGSVVWMLEESALATFGGQGSAESDAAWALAAAGEALREFGNLARDFDLPPAVAMGVGLDRGEVLGGLLGPRKRLLFSALGAPVTRARLAARLGSANAIRATGAVLDQVPNPRGRIQRLELADSGPGKSLEELGETDHELSDLYEIRLENNR
jgi:class 3 adenylate cyclase